jgi:tryptophanyl-tRNA synthetase
MATEVVAGGEDVMETGFALSEIDTTTPHPARIHGARLGGCDQPAPEHAGHPRSSRILRMSRLRVLSGIQPTADSFHLGNYLGALRQWVALQDSYDAFYCVVDLHAITVPQDPALLPGRTRVAAAQLLGAGLDPDRCTLFVQSHVPEHTELAWILGCITGFGEASRMTQFKDKSAKDGHEQASVGLFTYPVLQAADILLYQADQVPVGEDQRQHLELSRTLAQRFNHRYGQTFVPPQPYILAEVAKIYDLQDPTAKMSKSSSSPQGIVDVLDEPDVIRRKIARAVTDPGSEVRADPEAKPGVTNLLRIYSALSGEPVATLEAKYAGSGYGGFKKDLAELVVASFAPIRETTQRILADEAGLDRVLAQGAARARQVAGQTMAAVRDRMGLLKPAG